MTYLTVRAANGTELSHIRGKGQWSKLYLAIFKPSTVYSATLASLPSSSDSVTSINFTGGTGTLANVLPDMTLFVGSTPGGYDYGVARIRKTPIAGVFYIGEESDIYWEIGCYLTVVNEFDLWAKHIRTVSDTVFYMDYDVAYTDQNTNFSPIPIMGSHRVLKLTGVSVSTTFNWTNSYCIGSSVTGYSVSCATANITGGTTGAPVLEFTSTGWHTVVLTVTAANGKTSVGVRYVYVYSTSAMPARVFQLEGCSGDYETGGWNFSVNMQDEIGLSTVPERTMCILFAEDYYGDTQVSHGQLDNCENIICVGKIAEENTSLDPEMSEVSLTIYGMQYWMEKVYAFPTGALLDVTPSNWGEMPSPTVDKILFRLFHWGSTVTKIMDVYLTNDTRIASELISPASNLWAQVQEIAFATVYARPGVDRFGRLFVEVEPQVVPVASRTWPSVMTITEQDWQDSVRIQRVVVTPQSQINASGVWVISNGNGGALFSLAPGHVFKHYGSPDVIDRLLLSTQALSNQFAGLLLNWKNNQFPNSEMQLTGNNRMIDCFPRQKVTWSVSAGDNPRGFSFNKGFIPRRVEYKWDPDTGLLSTAISIEMEVGEGIYVNGDIPGSGDYDPADPPTPPAYPPLPDFPPITPGDVNPGIGAKKVIFLDSTGGLIYTDNFDADSPTYTQINAGLGAQPWGVGVLMYQRINRFYVTPSGAIYACQIQSMGGGNWGDPSKYAFVYGSPYPGGTFQLIVDSITLGQPGYFERNGVYNVGINATLPDNVMICSMTAAEQTIRAHVGSLAGGFNNGYNGLPSTGGGDGTGGSISYGMGKWLYTQNANYVFLSADGTSLLGNGSDGNLSIVVFNKEAEQTLRASTGPVLVNAGGTTYFVRSTDNFATRTPISVPENIQQSVGMAIDPTGNFLMGRWGGSAYKGKSTDGGYSWAGLPNLPPGNWYFAFAGMNGSQPMWIAAGAAIRFSPDNGVTWIEKTTASYTAINPLPSIYSLKVFG